MVTDRQRVGRGSFITARARSGGQSLPAGSRERNAGLDGHLLMGRRERETGVDTKQNAICDTELPAYGYTARVSGYTARVSGYTWNLV